ncbi:MAG TPA: hypothetical protein VHY76_09025, partial [Acetobacteraceae bacterium]|nr:hypothetical protein [Acetobacteraceae bacterium]
LVNLGRLAFCLVRAAPVAALVAAVTLALIGYAQAQSAPNYGFAASPATQTAIHAFCAHASEISCSTFVIQAAHCEQDAGTAYVTMSTVQFWVQKGLTPRQAAATTLQTTNDLYMAQEALVAEESPGRPSPDEFRKTVLAGCLYDAAQ